MGTQYPLVPSAAEGQTVHADWLELHALASRDGNASAIDLTRALHRTGSVEAISMRVGADGEPVADPDVEDAPWDSGSERLEAIGESALAEVDNRARACLGRPAYPFMVGANFVQLPQRPADSIYVFLLLLSHYGISAGPTDMNAARLFEEVSLAAAKEYMSGGRHPVESFLFGAPRRQGTPGFADALDELCRQMKEGTGAKRDEPSTSSQKDGGLDLVVWRPFPDGRTGKLIAMGQCAAGANWSGKTTDLSTRAFCATWMQSQPMPEPIGMFFTPLRVPDRVWQREVAHSGIVFDRCRIAAFAKRMPTSLREQCRAWSRHVVAARVRT